MGISGNTEEFEVKVQIPLRAGRFSDCLKQIYGRLVATYGQLSEVEAAKLMGVSRRTLHRKLAQWPELDVLDK